MIGSYRVKSLVGSGGVATVYLAEHPVIGTEVAVKVLHPELAGDPTMVERFVLEARATSRIQSPHIPHYLDYGKLPGGGPYAVMEYFRGETVAARLRRAGPFTVAQAADMITQVAVAMH